jgi:hypothetical protein
VEFIILLKLTYLKKNYSRILQNKKVNLIKLFYLCQITKFH